MKTHTNAFKNQIKEFGRELDSIITYTLDNSTIELGGEQLNSVSPHYESAILKSTMRQLDIDSNEDIPIGTVVNYQFGVKVRDDEVQNYKDNYDYVNFGNYIVYKSEKQEDTQSYKITCYDKMLNAMTNYIDIGITYPITIRNYINAICTHLGITFKNANGTFANYNREIPEERYLDENGDSLGYTFRDVLDELAQVTASTICINEVDDELEIRYITNSNDTIDEEYLKDVNVNFGEKYGPINTIVLSRSSDTDNIYYPDPLPQNPFELKISENQIMNFEDRADYLPDIYNKLNGLEYYISDYSSTGICYYNVCDRYNVSIGENTYSCIMLNDEVNVTQGLEEHIYADMPEETVTEHKYSTEAEKEIRKASIIINQKISQVDIRGKTINLDADNIQITSPNFKVTSDGQIISTSGTIGGYKIGETELYAETFASHDFTQTDLDKIRNYLFFPETYPLTPEELELYDLNNDGVVNSSDLFLMRKWVDFGVTTQNSAKIIMSTGNDIFDNAYKLEDGNGNEIVKIGFDGLKYRGGDILSSHELYDDPAGTNGNIILSDDASKYEKIIIYYTIPDYNYVCGSQTIYDPTNNPIILSENVPNSGNSRIYLLGTTLSISGANLTVLQSYGFAMQASPYSVGTTNKFYITRIEGYK